MFFDVCHVENIAEINYFSDIICLGFQT